MRRLTILLLILWMLTPTHSSAKTASAQKGSNVTISVSVSPDSPFVSTLSFWEDSDFAKQVNRARTMPATLHPDWVRARITVEHQTYLYDHDGRLFEKDRPRLKLLSQQTKQRLEEYVCKVEKIHYGQALPWEQVKKTFRRMSYASVLDLETGERFRVQRRAGSRHADVQPLTRDDTRIMKNIYQGKWSWKRRAILVEVDGIHFAASMHGMPHGAGAIQGNDFDGHFCIHFLGSSTHMKKEPDPSHSLMILKASGTLPQTMTSAEPKELVDYFLSSLHEHDYHTLRMTTDGSPLPDELFAVEGVKKTEELVSSDGVGPFLAAIPVRLDFSVKSRGDRTGSWVFLVYRPAPWERWRIISVSMRE